MSERIEVIAELKDLITGKFREINGQIDAMTGKLNQASGRTGGGGIMGQVLGANLLTNAIMRAGSAMKDFAIGSAQAYGRQEQFQVALKTLLYGNEQQANALNNQLKQFALETPFELSEIQQTTRLLIAYGSAAGSVVDEMRMLGDVASGTAQPIGEIAYLYGTIRQQQVANHVDLKQFANRGIPIFKELAKVTKYSLQELVAGGKDVKVTFQDIQAAFKSMTAEGSQFGGMMGQQSKTLLGQVSNLSDSWDQLKVAIGESQSGILKDTVSWATSMVSELRKVAEGGNFLDKSQKPLGKAGISMGTFDHDWTDERDIRYLNLKTNQFTANSKRREKLDYAGAGLYHDKTASGADAGLTSKMYHDFYNPEISAKGQLKMFSDNIFEKTSNLNEKTLQDLKNELTTTFREIQTESKTGRMSPMMAASKLAIIDQAWKDIKGFDSLNKTKTDEEKKAEAKPKELEKVAKQNRSMQVHVEIHQLVGELTNNVGTPKEALQMNTQEVSKALVAAVNDIYAVGM